MTHHLCSLPAASAAALTAVALLGTAGCGAPPPSPAAPAASAPVSTGAGEISPPADSVAAVRALPTGPVPPIPVAYTPFAPEGPALVVRPDGTRTSFPAPYQALNSAHADARGIVALAVRAGSATGPQPSQVELVALDTAGAVPLVLRADDVAGYAVSPDGTRVAVLRGVIAANAPARLEVLDRASGKLTAQVPYGTDSRLLGWTPSGIVARRGAADGPGEVMEVLDPAGKVLRTLPPASTASVVTAQDAAVLWAAPGADGKNVRTISLSTGAVLAEAMVPDEVGTQVESADGTRIVAGTRVLDASTLRTVARLPVALKDPYATVWATGYVAQTGADGEVLRFACTWSGAPECHRVKDFPPEP